MKSAAIIGEQERETPKVSIGDSIILRDLDSGEERHYIIVSPKEEDPASGKISSASPIGKAVIDKELGETVEIAAPAGKLRYRIKQIER